MCETLDGDLDTFEASIGRLRNLGRTIYDYHIVDGEMEARDLDDPVYCARRDICEKSRFAWLSTMHAVDYYCDSILDQPGFTPEPRARRIHRLFEEAVDLLSSLEDRFLRNVRARRDEVAPRLVKHLSAGLAAST